MLVYTTWNVYVLGLRGGRQVSYRKVQIIFKVPPIPESLKEAEGTLLLPNWKAGRQPSAKSPPFQAGMLGHG